MHDRAVMRDLVAHIEQTAHAAGAARVTKIEVQLGALSHFTPAHFREHFEDASRGTVAEGADVVAELDDDVRAERARDAVLTSVEVEF